MKVLMISGDRSAIKKEKGFIAKQGTATFKIEQEIRGQRVPQNGDEKLSAELTQCLSAKKRRSASLAKAPSLRPELNADGIHMNANFLPLLERELKGVSRNASQRK